ncbi:MAG: DUF5020 family protein [bacterium]|nr:DUF5020 family protein [bacterium]
MKKFASILVLSVIVLTMTAGSSLAAIWSTTDVCFLYGSQNQKVVFNPDSGMLEGEDQDMTTITIEHSSAWNYGDNFFFFDMNQPFDTNSGIYGEWHPRLSFGKISGNDLSFAFVKDVLLATELNISEGGRVYLYGAGFDLDIPHFQFLSLNFYIRNNPAIEEETTFQISPAWNIPFALGSAQFEFRGFLDYAGSAGSSEANLLTQPQLLLDLGSFNGKTGSFYAGVEYIYWSNKYGIKDIDENYVQLMGKWIF